MWQLRHYCQVFVMLCSVNALAVRKITINTKFAVGMVDKMFIGMTLDSSQFATDWKYFNFTSDKLLTLLTALSPAYLRVGGSSAEWLFFDQPLKVLRNNNLRPRPNVMTKQDVVNLVLFTRKTNARLIFDLNLQLRYGIQWNPSQAIELFKFCIEQGFQNDIDWELGNEPDDYVSLDGQSILSGQQIGQDFMILRNTLSRYSGFNASSILGPDIANAVNSRSRDIIKGVINAAGSFLKAFTFHHYYFRGSSATYMDYINPKHFIQLANYIKNTKSIVSESAHPNLTLWIGETSDAYNSGTVNVSDRFVSGFLWMDKLGLAALGGINVVLRQTLSGGFYGLLDIKLNPNPDYWLTLLHHNLVGEKVLSVSISGGIGTELETLRLYAHCTSDRSGKYKAGAVTVFGLNVSPNETMQLMFTDNVLKSQQIDLYMLTPENKDLLSSLVTLNGKILMMVDDRTLPHLQPLSLPPGHPVELTPLSLGFFVFPFVEFPLCL